MQSVLFISTMKNNEWGGSEAIWYRTALYARKKGHPVAVGVFKWKNKKPYLQQLKDAGCIVYEFPIIDKTNPNKWEKFLNNTFYRLLQFIAVKKLPVHKYDVVLVNQGGFRDIVKWPFKHFYKRHSHISLTFHNYLEQYTFKKRRAQTLIKWIDHCSHTFFAAGRTKVVLEQQLNTIINNDVVFFNPIGFDVPRQPSGYPSLQNGKYNFTILAYLDIGRKAQDRVIKTLANEKWKQRNWILNIYGEGGDRRILEQLIINCCLENKVFLKGHYSEVKELLQQTHLFLQITKQDAMPISVVEAMAMARPLVVSKIGDMPRWVEEGKNGFLATDVLEENIDKALELAWQRRDEWAQMGEKSYQIFQSKFPAIPETFLLEKMLST